MKRALVFVAVLAVAASGCAKSATAPSTSTLRFTADLKTVNEVPPIVAPDPEAAGSGTATIVIDGTKVTFIVNLTGFPAGTPINIAHIHGGNAGTIGGVLVSTTLSAGDVRLTDGSGNFLRTDVPITQDLASAINANPSGYYFNVHSTLHAGGVARGQLVKLP